MAEAPIAELEYEINHARRKIGDYLPHTLLLVEDSVPAAAARQAFATCLGVQQYVKQALSKQNHYPGEFLNAASTWIGADIAARIVQPYAEKRDAIYAALDYSIGDSSLAHALGMHAQQLLRQGTNGDISTLCDAYFSGLKEQSQRLLEGKYPTELRELQETTLTLHLPPGLVKLLKQDTLAYTGLSSSPAILPSALPHITFADIGGNRSAKERLQEAVKDFQAREKRKFWGLSVEKNYLLFGPPGTGKTILAYAYAAALGLDAKELNMAEIYDPYIGKTEQKLREAMQMPEGVLIVNELDSFLRKKALQDNQVFVNVVNLFATELDRRKEDDAFHCITTANELGILEDKMQRAGRFCAIFVGYPTQEDMEEIFQVHVRKRTDCPVFQQKQEARIGNIDSNGIAAALQERSDALAEAGVPKIVGADIEKIVMDTFTKRFRDYRDKGMIQYPTTEDFLQEIASYWTRQREA